MLVRGKLSDVISDETVAEFLEAAPHAKYADVSDAGHMVAGDKNDVFSKAVLDFLAGVRPY
jgi:pimeloyl-ACP methyl ester carboxylesterase